MVYRDISNSNSSTEQNFKYSVSMMDRFFSFLIDYFVISPFVSFTLFIFFKDAIRYWRENPTAPEQTSLTLLLVFSYVSLFSAIQAGFITFWNSTPGQYFLKIRIVFENGDGLVFWRAFCRQFGFWLSAIFFGIPWLALLAHPLQQTFYDRIADCRVFSKKQSSNFFGFEIEGRYWRSFAATLILFVSLILVSVLVSQYRDVTNRTESFRIRDKKNLFCAELKGVNQSSRLQLAIAMNLVGQLSDECLDRESDFVLWKKKGDEIGLAYYAKSLTEDEKEAENKYLQQACLDSKEGMGCRLASAFRTGDFEKLYRQLKSQKDVLSKTLVYEFSAILNHNDDRDDYFSELVTFDSTRLIKKYLLSEIITRKTGRASRLPASDDEVNETEEQALELLKDL